jgi:hypothetical protein
MCDARAIRALPTTTDVLDALLHGWSGPERARIIQVAVAGRWEEARSIDMPTDPGSARSLVRDAGAPGADVAVEAEWLGHPLVFVGARRAQEDAPEERRLEDDVARLAELDPVEPAVALAALAGGPPAELRHVELGAANAWRSVGPMRLWTKGDSRPPASTAARLHERPTLARCIAPVALEVTFGRPRECWIGVEVSEPSADGHVVAPATLDAMIERLFAVGG